MRPFPLAFNESQTGMRDKAGECRKCCIAGLRLAPAQARLCSEMRTVEAVIDPDGHVRLVEPVSLPYPRRALVTILEEPPSVSDAALLSEAALAQDWDRPEEDAAWAHLQPGKSS